MTGDFIDTIHAQAQTLWDLRRLLSWVRAQDARQWASTASRSAALTTAMLATLESDLDCVVAGMPPACFAGLMRDNSPPIVQRLMDFAGFPWDVVQQLLRVVSPLAVKGARAARAPLSVCRHCRLAGAPWPGIGALASLERPRLAWYPGSHSSFMLESAVRDLLLEAFRRGRLVRTERAAAA
jgi:hypothetical protein